MRKHEACDAIGERRLADSDGTPDQPSMRNAAAAISRQQRLFRLNVPEQRQGVARMRRLDGDIIVVLLAHRTTSSLTTAADIGSSRLLTISQIFSATASSPSSVSIRTQRLGSLAAM